MVRVAETQLGSAEQQRGFSGFHLLVDHETGDIITISFWQSAEDAQAVELQAAQTRSDTASLVEFLETPKLRVYEVAVHK